MSEDQRILRIVTKDQILVIDWFDDYQELSVAISKLGGEVVRRSQVEIEKEDLIPLRDFLNEKLGGISNERN